MSNKTTSFFALWLPELMESHLALTYCKYVLRKSLDGQYVSADGMFLHGSGVHMSEQQFGTIWDRSCT